MHYIETLELFLEKTTCKDPFEDYAENTIADALSCKIDQKEKSPKTSFFIPMSKENLRAFFAIHKDEMEIMYDIVLKETATRITSFSIHPSDTTEELMLRFTDSNDEEYGVDRIVKIKKKFHTLETFTTAQTNPKNYELKYFTPVIEFLFFVHEEITFKTISSLEKEVAVLKEEKSSSPVSKASMNMLNVMLSNKEDTLNKLEREKKGIEKLITSAQPGAEIEVYKKLKAKVDEMIKNAKVHIPDDFRFTVYELYAILGIMILLHKNNFNPVELSPTAILRALCFSTFSKTEITEIRKAVNELTTKPFPCYHIRQDKSDPKIWHTANANCPIFITFEKEKVNLNVKIKAGDIEGKKLYISLLNSALIEDTKHFYTVINNNLLANLRALKKVTEEDIYFLIFIIREKHFKKQTKTSIDDICKKMKKEDWLKEDTSSNRMRKQRMLEKIKLLLDFAIRQKLVSKYSIESDGTVVINYLEEKPPLLLTHNTTGLVP